jgi:Icc-related predicted phosphoesterase
LNGGAFGLSNAEDRKRHWRKIPVGTEILITHGPPAGILDVEHGENDHKGCPQLLEAVLRVKPRLHVFGHIHGGYGVRQIGHTLFVNVSLVDELFTVKNAPIVLRLR